MGVIQLFRRHESGPVEEPPEPSSQDQEPRGLRALVILRAHDLPEARARALIELLSAGRCQRCRSVLAHLYDRVGSTLFVDDDPDALARMFEPCERDGETSRLLAACIVLGGRPRVVPAPVDGWES
jgi:hypothetical protein